MMGRKKFDIRRYDNLCLDDFASLNDLILQGLKREKIPKRKPRRNRELCLARPLPEASSTGMDSPLGYGGPLGKSEITTFHPGRGSRHGLRRLSYWKRRYLHRSDRKDWF